MATQNPDPATVIASLNALQTGLGKFVIAGAKAQLALNTFITGLVKAVDALGSSMTKFVQLANPATVIRFNRAMENFGSALGQILVPILERLTPLIQQIANAIVSLDEPTKKLLGGLALGASLAGALTAVIAAIGLVVSVVGGWAAALIALGSLIAGVVASSAEFSKVTEVVKSVLASVGTILQTIAKPIAALFSKIAEAVEPLLIALTPLIDAFGELFVAAFELSSIPLQILLEAFKALSPMFAQVGKLVAAVAQLVGTLISAFTKLATGALRLIGEVVLRFVQPAIEKLVEALQWMVNKILELVNLLRRQFGLKDLEKFDPEKNRAQATVKQASIGDVQSFLNRAYTASATGSGQSIPTKQLTELEKINAGIAGLPKGLAEALAAEMKKKQEGGVNGGPLAQQPSPRQSAPALPPLARAVIPGGPAVGVIWDLWRKAF